MTGAVAAAQYSVPPVVAVTVQLHNQTVSDLRINATAQALYTIVNDGTVQSLGGGVLESWLTGTGANPANYEVMGTQSSGSAVTGTLGTWLNCASSHSWSISNSARNNSVLTGVVTVQIRDVATHTVQATASITLSAESDSSGGGG